MYHFFRECIYHFIYMVFLFIKMLDMYAYFKAQNLLQGHHIKGLLIESIFNIENQFDVYRLKY